MKFAFSDQPGFGPDRGGEPAPRTIAIIGGGLSGALCGIKLSLARPDLRVVVIDPAAKIGQGLAYGACQPHHLLNVPVHRMETGLSPTYADWLSRRPDEISEALKESKGVFAEAFTARAQFGAYLHDCFEAVRNAGDGRTGLVALRGRAVALLDVPRRGVRLEDGREIEASAIVLATGNLPPARPGTADGWFYDMPQYVPDPWAPGALARLDPQQPLLVIGTGLTMVDISLQLAEQGHQGAILAVSRRGLAPQAHRAGGSWPPFLHKMVGASPRAILGRIRAETAAATAAGVPWQRVFDAARPGIASIWSGWTYRSRRQFLRHLRAVWDVHRHRIAPRVAARIKTLRADGRLDTLAARIAGYRMAENGQVAVSLALRGGGQREVIAGAVINCTGPASNFKRLAIPLFESLKGRGLAHPDHLGLGLDTLDCALIQADGSRSDWLYALGPVTRPAWWEITATPEIVLQVDRLVRRLAGQPTGEDLTAEAFLDLAAGI